MPDPPAGEAGASSVPRALLYALFWTSGAAAILYQLIWQRVLAAIYGTNAEATTIVVTAFMLGLGLGSLAGGALSTSRRIGAPMVFGLLEISIAAFGFVSIDLFWRVGAWSAQWPAVSAQLLALVILLVPAVLMGATLPVLVAHVVAGSARVGRAVGGLYFVNTLGSAAGATAAVVLIGPLGQHMTAVVAASLNLFAAACMIAWPRRTLHSR